MKAEKEVDSLQFQGIKREHSASNLHQKKLSERKNVRWTNESSETINEKYLCHVIWTVAAFATAIRHGKNAPYQHIWTTHDDDAGSLRVAATYERTREKRMTSSWV